MVKIYILIGAVLFAAFCQRADHQQSSGINTLVNSSHLDSLYEEININGSRLGIIHIYSDYPNYDWVGDDDEGIACVDDASRAAVFYLRDYKLEKHNSSLVKAEMLINFLLFMQSDNKFFYNFILPDHSINKKHENSINVPNWWSWRAMWALSEGYGVFKDTNPEFAKRIIVSLIKSVDAVKKTFPDTKISTMVNGIKLPTWLPFKSAGDQAAVLSMALVNYYEETRDTSIIKCINNLCDGILMLQKGSKSEIPYYAFLSWENVWHAYGNSQSYALLRASKILHRTDLQSAALNEINYFYDMLFRQNFLSSFKIEKDSTSFKFVGQNEFPQIAYNFRPMIFACFEAFDLTGDNSYKAKAVELAGWFLGRNAASKQMYDYSSGICFDGINSENEVNLNSGAESTIEALLSMQQLGRYNISREDLMKELSTKRSH
jgi:hypothetical protein